MMEWQLTGHGLVTEPLSDCDPLSNLVPKEGHSPCQTDRTNSWERNIKSKNEYLARQCSDFFIATLIVRFVLFYVDKSERPTFNDLRLAFRIYSHLLRNARQYFFCLYPIYLYILCITSI
jgi:hypothetical protein